MTIFALAVILFAAQALGRRTTAGPRQGRLDRPWPGAASCDPGRPHGPSAVLSGMNRLLRIEHDPVLRTASPTSAGRALDRLREHRLSAADLRVLLQLWTRKLGDGLGTAGDDRCLQAIVFRVCLPVADRRGGPVGRHSPKRNFTRSSTACSTTFSAERDLRSFDPVAAGCYYGCTHIRRVEVPVPKSKLAEGSDTACWRDPGEAPESHDAVFAWGENDRVAQAALQSAVRRQDADTAAQPPGRSAG